MVQQNTYLDIITLFFAQLSVGCTFPFSSVSCQEPYTCNIHFKLLPRAKLSLMLGFTLNKSWAGQLWVDLPLFNSSIFPVLSMAPVGPRACGHDAAQEEKLIGVNSCDRPLHSRLAVAFEQFPLRWLLRVEVTGCGWFLLLFCFVLVADVIILGLLVVVLSSVFLFGSVADAVAFHYCTVDMCDGKPKCQWQNNLLLVCVTWILSFVTMLPQSNKLGLDADMVMEMYRGLFHPSYHAPSYLPRTAPKQIESLSHYYWFLVADNPSLSMLVRISLRTGCFRYLESWHALSMVHDGICSVNFSA